ncbi:hypothetical protein LV28_15295 [Pandoraea pnomenusa]|uniref:Uncharacterized protein n=1 Tax=Pandoraea pnomenusa TaxID=93220 RepID=A0A378YPL2_9BURK|nr:hypothetical protein [Pandoraea pnomenusa]AIU27721.1 hypothetical protein LV28_15295 [Pandoraea pnomenusa]SUA79054.1 Uncharacterised protein [Pandoraea pnomenusa]
MTISLQALAANSAPLIDNLAAADPTKLRFAMRNDGTLVVYKGHKYLLHPQQCRRAMSFMKRNDLLGERRSHLNPKHLRLNSEPARKLVDLVRSATGVGKPLTDAASHRTAAGKPNPMLTRASLRSSRLFNGFDAASPTASPTPSRASNYSSESLEYTPGKAVELRYKTTREGIEASNRRALHVLDRPPETMACGGHPDTPPPPYRSPYGSPSISSVNRAERPYSDDRTAPPASQALPPVPPKSDRQGLIRTYNALLNHGEGLPTQSRILADDDPVPQRPIPKPRLHAQSPAPLGTSGTPDTPDTLDTPSAPRTPDIARQASAASSASSDSDTSAAGSERGQAYIDDLSRSPRTVRLAHRMRTNQTL